MATTVVSPRQASSSAGGWIALILLLVGAALWLLFGGTITGGHNSAAAASPGKKMSLHFGTPTIHVGGGKVNTVSFQENYPDYWGYISENPQSATEVPQTFYLEFENEGQLAFIEARFPLQFVGPDGEKGEPTWSTDNGKLKVTLTKPGFWYAVDESSMSGSYHPVAFLHWGG